MDYSLCNALSYNTRDLASDTGIKEVLVVYDIACQYSVHFTERREASSVLKKISSLGWDIVLTWAIGKFHLGAHIPTCYPKFSLNHKTGAGEESGETAEFVWALLNIVFTTARAQSLAHRQEHGNNAMNSRAWDVNVSVCEFRN